MILFLLQALFMTQPDAPRERLEKWVQVSIEADELAPGLSLSLRAGGLALHAGARRLAHLRLPGKPVQARRVGDHAILALGKHGLWVVRVTRERRLKVLHTLYPGPWVDGFEISGDHVFPTTGKARVRILAKPPASRSPRKKPPERAPPPSPPPFADLVQDELHRMPGWPRPRLLSNGWLEPPWLLLEFNLPWQAAVDADRLDDEGADAVHPSVELTFRLGHHLGRGHIVGLNVIHRPWEDPIQDGSVEEGLRRIRSLTNPVLLFYRYAIPRTPLGVQAEPIRVEWDPDRKVEYGVRWTLQVTKHTTPARIGLELHLDLTPGSIRPTLALVLGMNF